MRTILLIAAVSLLAALALSSRREEKCPGGVCPTETRHSACLNPECDCDPCECVDCDCVTGVKVERAIYVKPLPDFMYEAVSNLHSTPATIVMNIAEKFPAPQKMFAASNDEVIVIPKEVINPRVTINKKVESGPEWRLRILHPTKNDAGLTELFKTDKWFREFGLANNLLFIQTDNDESAKPWLANGYKKDEISIVLVDPQGEVKLYRHGKSIRLSHGRQGLPPTDDDLRSQLESARNPVKAVSVEKADCPNCKRKES